MKWNILHAYNFISRYYMIRIIKWYHVFSSSQWKVLKMLWNRSYTNEAHIMFISSSPGTTWLVLYITPMVFQVNGKYWRCYEIVLTQMKHIMLISSSPGTAPLVFQVNGKYWRRYKIIPTQMKYTLCLYPHHQVLQYVTHIYITQ